VAFSASTPETFGRVGTPNFHGGLTDHRRLLTNFQFLHTTPGTVFAYNQISGEPTRSLDLRRPAAADEGSSLLLISAADPVRIIDRLRVGL
jgi:hypothetical protein